MNYLNPKSRHIPQKHVIKCKECNVELVVRTRAIYCPDCADDLRDYRAYVNNIKHRTGKKIKSFAEWKTSRIKLKGGEA